MSAREAFFRSNDFVLFVEQAKDLREAYERLLAKMASACPLNDGERWAVGENNDGTTRVFVDEVEPGLDPKPAVSLFPKSRPCLPLSHARRRPAPH